MNLQPEIRESHRNRKVRIVRVDVTSPRTSQLVTLPMLRDRLVKCARRPKVAMLSSVVSVRVMTRCVCTGWRDSPCAVLTIALTESVGGGGFQEERWYVRVEAGKDRQRRGIIGKDSFRASYTYRNTNFRIHYIDDTGTHAGVVHYTDITSRSYGQESLDD